MDKLEDDEKNFKKLLPDIGIIELKDTEDNKIEITKTGVQKTNQGTYLDIQQLSKKFWTMFLYGIFKVGWGTL